MSFNPQNSQLMDFGRIHKAREYTMNNRTPGSTEDQRDLGLHVHRTLGLHVHRTLKTAGQNDQVVKKGYGILAFFSRGIEY